MLMRKVSIVGGAGGLRTMVLRNQLLTAYDIHMIHWIVAGTDALQTNELGMLGFSTNARDQTEDTAPVGFDDFVQREGIFGVFAVYGDVLTSGGIYGIGNHTIVFPKPYRVPYAAFIANIAFAVTTNLGGEIYFDRVRVSAQESAELAAQAGGRDRTE